MKLLMKYISFFIIAFVLFACSSSKKSTQTDVSFSKKEKIKIMSGEINFGPEAKNEISQVNVEAAFNLASGITGKYSYISNKYRDSLIKKWKDEKRNFNSIDIKNEFGVKNLYFFQIDRLCNVIRTEIEKVNVLNPKIRSKGIGYGLVHHFREKSEIPIYDPALLASVQRAFAIVENDSMMYYKAKDDFRVFPANTLVIAGIEFVNDSTIKEWDLFKNKEVNSYDAVESEFEVLRNHDKYTVFDIASRDSIYALFNLRIVDNFKAPNAVEISALNRLEVNNYLTGEVKRYENGAKITLILCEIKENRTKVLRTETENIENDNIDDFRAAIKKAAKKNYAASINIYFKKYYCFTLNS